MFRKIKSHLMGVRGDLKQRRSDMSTGLYAFWKHDSYPYILGGEVVSVDERGFVKTKEFGGHMFRPLIIVPVSRGKEVHTYLRNLKDSREKAVMEVEGKYREDLASYLRSCFGEINLETVVPKTKK